MRRNAWCVEVDRQAVKTAEGEHWARRHRAEATVLMRAVGLQAGCAVGAVGEAGKRKMTNRRCVIPALK